MLNFIVLLKIYKNHFCSLPLQSKKTQPFATS
nr:MAG TPA_asm: hypothetical protein [Caudoviricetes sp.]